MQTSTTPVILQIFLSTAMATVLVAVINALVNRRKLGADVKQTDATTAESLTNTATNILQTIREDNVRLRTESRESRERERRLEDRVDELEDAQREWERDRDDMRDTVSAYAKWSEAVIAAVEKVVPPINLPSPPARHAPRRPRRKPAPPPESE